MGLFGPNVPFIIDFMMLGETLLAVLLVLALIMAATHRGRYHHFTVQIVFFTDLLVFKPLMLMRATDGTNGYFPWEGTSIMWHLVVTILVLVLGAVTIYLGYRNVVRKDGNMFMPKKGRVHRLVGAAYIGLWLLTYAIGVSIFFEAWY